jgi:hypothetical protein
MGRSAAVVETPKCFLLIGIGVVASSEHRTCLILDT